MRQQASGMEGLPGLGPQAAGRQPMPMATQMARFPSRLAGVCHGPALRKWVQPWAGHCHWRPSPYVFFLVSRKDPSARDAYLACTWRAASCTRAARPGQGRLGALRPGLGTCAPAVPPLTEAGVLLVYK